ncbi:MAG: radical SAM protein [Chitinivibrionia bacterium]|nr:radical SAM protein [Chitinivibrionia bacterium]
MIIKNFIKAMVSKGIIPQKIVVYVLSFVRHVKQRSRNFVFLVHVADHCNLNCKHCDNFSPLAQEVFLDFEQYKKDCERIAKLTDGKIGEVSLLGGEPLLNPDIIKIIETTRTCFAKNVVLSIVTNGILLAKQFENFWNCCRENNVKIIVTKYPVKLDYKKIDELARNYGIKLKYWGGDLKTSYHSVLDLDGKHNPKKSFRLCYKSNSCIYLSKGRLYTCPTIPYIHYFNKHFGQNLQVSDNDSIDIYKAESIKEIRDFLAKPIPFCRYCAAEKTEFGIPWGVSKKTMEEWT